MKLQRAIPLGLTLGLCLGAVIIITGTVLHASHDAVSGFIFGTLCGGGVMRYAQRRHTKTPLLAVARAHNP